MKVRNSQKGFTLVEMLVMMAVGGILLSGVVTAIFQTVNVTAHSSTQITALEDIKIVAHQLSKDIRISSNTTLADPAVGESILGLTWTTWYKETDGTEDLISYGIDHYCEYTLLGEEGEIQLQYWEWDCDPAVEGEDYCNQENWWESILPINTTTVGWYISKIEFSREGSIITAAITSSPDGKAETAETRTYHFYVRLKEELVQ